MSVKEKDFLPAALEILETPSSPLGSLTIWLLCIFFAICLAWAIIGQIDVVAVSQGKAVPLGKTKTVQSFESGVIQDIFVHDGKRVEEGDVLIELDATVNTADMARLKRELNASQVVIAKNRWLLEAIEGKEPGELALDAKLSEDEFTLQQLLVQSQLREYKAAKESLHERIIEKETELKVSTGQLAKLQETLPLLAEQVDGLEGLATEGITSRFKYLEKEEALLIRKRDISIEKDRLKLISASIRALKKQKEQHREEVITKLLQELTEASNTKVSIQQELVKAKSTESLLVLRAPVTGVVQQLAKHTIGGVIKGGDPIMIIVPEERLLQAEVAILNKDIGFVRVGQKVEIKLEAFPFTKYGIIEGKVISIDRDAVNDENQGLIYPARVAMAAESILVAEKPVPLSPGMGLTAEIKIGTRRLVEFVLAPIFRYKEESLRER